MLSSRGNRHFSWRLDRNPPTDSPEEANNGGIPNWGYTHFHKMFNSRQLLGLCQLLSTIVAAKYNQDVRDHGLGYFQQYLRNQNMFCIYDVGYDKLAPFFSNANYAPKSLTIENSVFGPIGRGNWIACEEKVVAGIAWARDPLEAFGNSAGSSLRLLCGDPVINDAALFCQSSTDLPVDWQGRFDLVITDPPFGNNLFYGDLANYFYVWLRPILQSTYPDVFCHRFSPRSQECVADRSRFPVDGDADAEHLDMKPADVFYEQCLRLCWEEAMRVTRPGGLLAFTFHHSADAPWESVLRSLFDAGWILEATFPIKGDETKGEGSRPGTFGSQKTEYDMIHVCRKPLEQPTPVSWAKMRQWVKREVTHLKALLEAYKSRELTEGDVRVILRGKALEFYSRHYGQVFTAENEAMPIRDALLGINQLLDEDTGQPGERPPSVVQPIAYQFLRLLGQRESLSRDEVSKSLRGTGIVQRELEQRGWIEERGKTVYRVPIHERFEQARKRPRKEMKTEIDQAHFLIGAAMPGSGVNVEDELTKDTWMVRRSVKAVLDWYAKTAVEPEIQTAAKVAGDLLRRSREQNREKIKDEQGLLFDDLYDEE